MSNKNGKIVIIGAGLAGCFMAICLARRGYKVNIYERFTKEELTQEATNRSFNLTIYYRGVQAFKKIGLWEAVQPVLRTLKGSAAHSVSHGVDYTPFDTEEKPQYVIERTPLLQSILKEAIKHKNITLHLTTPLVSIDRWNKTVTVQDAKTGKLRVIPCDVVFGADGKNSLVRSFIQQEQDTVHKQEYHTWTYKQVTIPEKIAKKLDWVSESQNFVHAKNALVVAFPNVDKSFTAMVLLPQNSSHSFSSLTTKKAISLFLSKRFPNLRPAHDILINSFLKHPEGRLTTITTIPWYFNDFAVIIGDAAHGLLPFYGQGISAAFEDCLVIDSLIDTYNGDWKNIFQFYQEKRKQNTDLLAYFSKESFERMNKYKQVDIYAIQNRLDLILHNLFPKIWLPPIYQLISDDPDDFQDILKKHKKRQTLAKYLGITATAWTIYGALLAKQKLFNQPH